MRFPDNVDNPGPTLEPLYAQMLECGFGRGQPLDFMTSMSERPDILEAVWGLARTLMIDCTLSAGLVQRIVLEISKRNDCNYCVVIHRTMLGRFQDGLAATSSAAALTDQESAILAFALKAAHDGNDITDEDFRTLRAVGLGDGQITEIVMLAAFTNFINVWADVSGIEPDIGRLIDADER